MKGSIGIKGLEIHCIIGVYDQERIQPRPLLIDLEIEIEMEKFNDTLKETVNYETIASIIKEIGVEGKYELLETFAYFALRSIHERFSPKKAKIHVEKGGAIQGVKACFVELEMTEEEFKSGG